MKKNLNDRIASSGRKLSLNKESLKRLAGEDLSHIAGGMPPNNSAAGDCITYWIGGCN